MADSETSRTLPSDTGRKDDSASRNKRKLRSRITRKSLLGEVAKILLSLTTELEQEPDRMVPGPSSTARLWLNWFEAHQRLVRITKYQQQIESKVFAMAGAYPVVQIEASPKEPALTVYSIAEIDRLKSRVDPTKLAAARSLLRKRREDWNFADRQLGLSSTLAFERDLSKQEQALSRVISLSSPKTLVEVTAKLHCLLSMQDPGNRRHDAPWTELRRILLDLTELERSY
ncbi:hypothetical protein [Rhizobium wenxiniae]|uniref:hypothetical protein n=1 Tax=Rhizobium wenxiniae TaxID=1737357 RepID=UPI003C1B2992